VGTSGRGVLGAGDAEPLPASVDTNGHVAMRSFVQVVLQNTQRVGERELSRSDRLRGGRVGHHLTQDAMSEEQAVELLHDAAWSLAAQLDGGR
jgi:hypothetical protein